MEVDSRTTKPEQVSPKVERELQKVWERIVAPSTSELKDYGEETTLHGLKYVFQSQRHPCERIFWTISFVSGIVMAGFLIYGVCTSYLKNPVVVTYQVEETKISDIPFPGVTLCNTNRVRKSVAAEIIKSAKKAASLALNPCSTGVIDLKENNNSLKTHLKKLKSIDYICQIPTLFRSSKNSVENNSLYGKLLEEFHDANGCLNATMDIEAEEFNDFRDSASHSCNDIALHCRWANREYNCSEFFSSLITDEGYCCAFNKVPATTVVDIDSMFVNAAEEAAWGTDILMLNSLLGKTTFDWTIRVLLENIAKIRTQQRAGRTEGLSIVLNPQLEEYYCSAFNGPGFVFETHLPVDTPIGLGMSTPIPPKTEVFVSIIPEATFADMDTSWFNSRKRGCYFEGEYVLEVFKTYTRENCISECEGGLVKDVCGCQMFSISIGRNDTCGPDDSKCIANAFEQMPSKEVAEHCSYCLPTCNDLRYNLHVVTSPVSERNSEFHTGQSREYYQDWVRKGASILHVYFEHDSYYARERKQLYSFTGLIANIGGLLGLCLGFSGLSLIEMFYFLSIRPCFRRRGKESPEEEKGSYELVSNS